MYNNENISLFLDRVANGEGRGASVYFLGIGGIGMSAIARYFNSRGVKVTGYDRTETMLTDQLQSEGIDIHFEDDPRLIDTDAVFTVFTPAIPKTHKELNWLVENGSRMLKRAEVLGLITERSFNICVAGTHGKTTTSTMIAHVLRHSGHGCNAFLGGISSNYETNFWSAEQNICVAEADEYDRSFLKLSPDIAVVTAADPDHLDIYSDAVQFREAFSLFSARVKTGGMLIHKYGLDQDVNFTNDRKFTYSLNDTRSDSYARNIIVHNGAYRFDVIVDQKVIENIDLPMGGLHNVENAVACITVAHKCGINDNAIRKALSEFKGVRRRFEYLVRTEEVVMIDDYAHHPQELSALIGSAKSLYPGKKCTVIFQPHLYTRTRDFAEGFADSLSLADEVVLLPIYPARELPIEGVESQMLAEKINTDRAYCLTKSEMLKWVVKQNNEGKLELLITAGAGDIDTLLPQIKNILEIKK